MSVPLLISTEWLGDHLGDPDVRIADVRWSLLEKDKGRNAYLTAHVPGAVFLDVDEDLASPRGQGPGRHPLPAKEKFAASMSGAGIGPSTHVVAYDFGDGSTAAPVVAPALLRTRERVAARRRDRALDRRGRPLESGVASYQPASFAATPHPDMLVDADAVERLRQDPRTLLLDARRRSVTKAGSSRSIRPPDTSGRAEQSLSDQRQVSGRPALPRSRAIARSSRLGADRAGARRQLRGSGINACQNLFALALAGSTAGCCTRVRGAIGAVFRRGQSGQERDGQSEFQARGFLRRRVRHRADPADHRRVAAARDRGIITLMWATG
jgi:thiosulfate/3-mercaptopyruvate sulfurtransferase